MDDLGPSARDHHAMAAPPQDQRRRSSAKPLARELRGWTMSDAAREIMVLTKMTVSQQETAVETGVEGRGGHTAGIGTVTVMITCYGTRYARLAVSSLRAKSANLLKFKTLWRGYSCETLL